MVISYVHYVIVYIFFVFLVIAAIVLNFATYTNYIPMLSIENNLWKLLVDALTWTYLEERVSHLHY